ncbi:hypothetical protein AX17_000886 [Amanita inopinata Kibby_2008]|nr:hypothetical protein AX17_000886 [Amanita inopinata Kibby_2008]
MQRCSFFSSLLPGKGIRAVESNLHDGRRTQFRVVHAKTAGVSQESRPREDYKKAGHMVHAILRSNTSHPAKLEGCSSTAQSREVPSGCIPRPSMVQISSTGEEEMFAEKLAQCRVFHISGKSDAPAIKKLRHQVDNSAHLDSVAKPDMTVMHCGSTQAPKAGGVANCRTLRSQLLNVLELTLSASEAWDAYTTLINLSSDGYDTPNEAFIPFAHLHRLCRLLSRRRPKTHTQFLRLLSVLTLIRSAGGQIHLHEWNALIDHAGKGWRRTRLEDWETALSLFNDMVTGRTPGASLSGNIEISGTGTEKDQAVEPDIYTYTTLINIAVDTRHAPAVHRATALLNGARLRPNRVTHLTLLKHFSNARQLSGVRSMIFKMREQELELGLDGLNACIWAYGQNGKPDVAMMIYRLLRHNVSPEHEVDGEGSVHAVAQYLREEEYIIISDSLKPDEATFALVIQVMAYHGNLLATLSVFMDMLAYLCAGRRQSLGRDRPQSVEFGLMNAAFRAVFLGFSRHGMSRLREGKQLPPQLRLTNPPDRPQWSLQNLETVFDTFLSMPEEVKASRSTLHWIMDAFDKTSGGDEELLRDVWKKLDARFGMCWVAPTNRLGRWKTRLFPEMDDERQVSLEGLSRIGEDEVEEEAFML